jgi:hypothetical protein
MHAAITSAFRHWFDPSYHFQDQFEMTPAQSPQLTFYVMGALLALVLPITWAVKVTVIAFLALLPLGLAVYCKGLKKDPLIGVAAAGFAWSSATHWGFISFMGALGLTMMGLGLALMTLDRPSRGRSIALGAVSVLLFFTHMSAVPSYLVAVAILLAVMAPARSDAVRVAALTSPAAVLLGLWWLNRPAELSGPIALAFDVTRTAHMSDDLLRGFSGPEEASILMTMLALIAGVGAYSIIVRRAASKREGASLRASPTEFRRALAPVLVAAMFLGLYFTLPKAIGIWSWVYPRELTAAVLCALAALPGLPVSVGARAPAVAALLISALLPSHLVSKEYAAFETLTDDFQPVLAALPRAPKLGYIILDRKDGDGFRSPLLHFPAWIQAELGGWLSFHFAVWKATPFQFRTTQPFDVAPSTPDGFERRPSQFDISTRGKYFDWILIRAHESPAQRVAVDPALHLVVQSGTWWLYHRE